MALLHVHVKWLGDCYTTVDADGQDALTEFVFRMKNSGGWVMLSDEHNHMVMVRVKDVHYFNVDDSDDVGDDFVFSAVRDGVKCITHNDGTSFYLGSEEVEDFIYALKSDKDWTSKHYCTFYDHEGGYISGGLGTNSYKINAYWLLTHLSVV